MNGVWWSAIGKMKTSLPDQRSSAIRLIRRMHITTMYVTQDSGPNAADVVSAGKTMATTIDSKETEQTELEEKSSTMGFRANGAMCIVHSFEPKERKRKQSPCVDNDSGLESGHACS